MAPIDALLERAHDHFDSGQYRQAAKLLRQILHKNPNHVESLDMLSRIALKKRDFRIALELTKRATQLWPRNAALHKNLGKSYCGLGEFEQAIAALQTSLSLDNRQPEAYYFLGLALKNTGELNQAGHYFQKAFGLKPDYVGAYYRMADTLAEAHMFNGAVQFYQKAHDLAPNRADILVDLGNALRECSDDQSAEKCYRRAFELNPKSISALNNWSNLLRDHGAAEVALELMKQAVAIRPNLPVLQNGLGLAYELSRDWDEARACYQLAMNLDPTYYNPHFNLARLEQASGNLSGAEVQYQRAIEIAPDRPDAHFHLGILQLLQGNLEKGWPSLEYRWDLRETTGKKKCSFDKPAWDGSSLAGKTILTLCEPSLSESILFIRYLPKLKELGAKVLLRCPPEWRGLLSRCEGIDELCTEGDELPHFDVHAALLSLPHLLGTLSKDIHSPVGYLVADSTRVSDWREKMKEHGGIKVGIAWRSAGSAMRQNFRSIPVSYFDTFADLQQIQLVTLQAGYDSTRNEQPVILQNTTDLGNQLANSSDELEDTAALIKNLDLVITCDCFIAHLAGGLGIQTWVALEFVPEWRWFLDRNDSPWYPTVTLFRQQVIGDWLSVFAEIKKALADLKVQ